MAGRRSAGGRGRRERPKTETGPCEALRDSVVNHDSDTSPACRLRAFFRCGYASISFDAQIQDIGITRSAPFRTSSATASPKARVYFRRDDYDHMMEGWRRPGGRGDAVVQVKILPLAHLWTGDVKLDEHKPDPTPWKVFADGELIAAIERREDVGGPGAAAQRPVGV